MPDQLAIVHLPDPAKATGYRNALTEKTHFRVADLGAGLVAVEPTEGAGRSSEFFKLTQICDATSDLDDPATWEPVRRFPPRRRTDVDPDVYPQQMIDRANAIRDENPGIQAEFTALALNAFGAAEAGELDKLLALNLPNMLKEFPRGSLWQITVDEVLLQRMAFTRTQLALALTPDMPLGPDMDLLNAMADLTLTKGINFEAVMPLPLILLSPAALGVLIPCMPHVLVFCFGTGLELRRPYPPSFASLYRPSVLNDAKALSRSDFVGDAQPDDGMQLLTWWVTTLNRLYGHIADPTRFTDARGYYDATAATAWTITCERLIGDAISLLAEPQATDLDRVQMAFDLLDKAEALLGYERNQTGKGFTALLRRGRALPRLREAYATSLPDALADRLGTEAGRLFDGLYDHVRAEALSYRLTGSGVLVAKDAAERPRGMDNDTYVSTLMRTIRNTSHGVLEILTKPEHRALLATNSCSVPAELPALAPLIAAALLSDIDGLLDGTWRSRLAGQT